MFRYAWLAMGLVLAQVANGAESEPIWRIGASDGDYHDLAFTGLDESYCRRFADGVTFTIGRDDPAGKFSAVHPGPADRWAKRRSYAFRVRFTIADVSSSPYEFRIELAGASDVPPPMIRVAVNDQAARKVVRGGNGEIALIRPGKNAPRFLRFILPSESLQRGDNTIVVETIGGSWLLYDAWSLWQMSPDTTAPINVHARPTIFFVERDGRLLQQIRIEADSFMPNRPVQAKVTSGGEVLTCETFRNVSLGVASGAMHIEPTDVPRELTITLSSGDQRGQVAIEQTPQKKWRLYCTPGSHTDIGYTHLQTEVADLHNRNTDYALELIEDYPEYHWNLESSWAVQTWLHDRPATQHEQFFQAVRDDRIGVEAGYLNMLSGLCSAEELIRVLYYSARLHRDHDLPFVSCTITDSPSHVWPLPSILAGAGIRYLSVGVNQSRAPLFKQNIHHKSPFWWVGPDGQRVLTWFAQGYHQGNKLALTTRADTRRITPDAEANNQWVGMEQMRDRIEAAVMWWNGREDYPYDAVLFHGTHDDNVYIYADTAKAVEEFNKRYAFPKIVLCSNQTFFEYIEEHFADHIPTVRGCGGSWWEDGAGSSAFETAVNRRTHQDIIAAEAAWALAKATGAVKRVPQERLDQAWENILLYDEHTWGSQHSIGDPSSDPVQRQWAIKAGFAADAAEQTRQLLADGMGQWGERVDAPAGSVVVFNPSGHKRTGVVRVDIPREQMITFDGEQMPQQVVSHDVVRSQTVAFVAENIPALGYRSYDVIPQMPSDMPASTVRSEGERLENEYYRVVFDPKTGGVVSLVDKKRDRELVDRGCPYTFGQVIYAAGGHAGGRSPDPKEVQRRMLKDITIEPGAAGAVFSSMKSIGWMELFPHVEMEVTLYEHLHRVDFVYRLRKKLTYEKEGLYIAFPFPDANARFRYEVGGGSVRPNEDHFPGACRDWFAVQRWVTVHTDEGAVVWTPVDTPLVTLCGMTPGLWLDELPMTNGTIFAYVMNNYWYTNYKAGQDGEFEFRFSLTTGDAIDPAAASIFGESVVQPMRAVRKRTRHDDAPLPAEMSFCRVTPGNVMLTAIKPADDGDGLIVRVQEMAGKDTNAMVELGFDNIEQVRRCDLIERNQEPLKMEGQAVRFKMNANSLMTLRLKLNGRHLTRN